jgi:hypothetical protein
MEDGSHYSNNNQKGEASTLTKSGAIKIGHPSSGGYLEFGYE